MHSRFRSSSRTLRNAANLASGSEITAGSGKPQCHHISTGRDVPLPVLQVRPPTPSPTADTGGPILPPLPAAASAPNLICTRRLPSKTMAVIPISRIAYMTTNRPAASAFQDLEGDGTVEEVLESQDQPALRVEGQVEILGTAPSIHAIQSGFQLDGMGQQLSFL